MSSYGVGNRATISDSRSNFHTRVGYRTNVCRRRLASNLGRASESFSGPRGAHENHHDRLPGYRSEPAERPKIAPTSFVTASEPDSCRAAGERGPVARRDEGAGRNQQGFSLPLFAGDENEGRRFAVPLYRVC
jgi:hypothetical protein